MIGIKWTKTYDLKVDNRSFRVLVTEQDNHGFHASYLWYEKQRILKAPGQPGELTFQLEQRHAPTEADAVEQLMQWVKMKFGQSYTLLESGS